MDENLCNEKHKNVNEDIDRHEKTLHEHGKKIDQLEINNATNTVAIDNLCNKIGDLVGTIKWLIGLGGTSLVGFFFYALQQHLFK